MRKKEQPKRKKENVVLKHQPFSDVLKNFKIQNTDEKTKEENPSQSDERAESCG